MANQQSLLINAICEQKDLSVLMSNNLEELCDGNEDVIAHMKEYYGRYRSVPSVEVLQERFPHLEKISAPGNAEHYLDKVREEVIDTRMKSLFLKATQKLKSGEPATAVKDGLQSQLSKLDKFSGKSRDLNVMDLAAAEERYEKTREKAALMGGVPGIPTGIDFFDAGYTSGLAGGDLCIFLGWTGRGKSLLTTLIACNAYAQGKKPMIVSLEMSPEKVQDRALTIMGSGLFKNSDLALGAVDVDDFRAFAKKQKGKDGFVVIANDDNLEITPNFVQAKFDEHRPDIIIIDYAQLTSDNANSQDMTTRMRNMSKEYKRLAMANDIPVILISSATPDSTSAINTPPIIEQVAWSKQLSYDADLGVAVHKHEDIVIEDGWCIIEVICRKNRNGELFAGFIRWNINTGEWKIDYEINLGV